MAGDMPVWREELTEIKNRPRKGAPFTKMRNAFVLPENVISDRLLKESVGMV